MKKYKKYNLMKTKLVCLLGLLILTSCVDREFDLEPREKVEGRRLMVLSVLDNDVPISVVLSTVEDVNDEPIDYRVWDAVVVLYENGLAVDTLERFNQFRNVDVSNLTYYFSSQARTLIDGAVYQIKVNAPGWSEAISTQVSFEKVFHEDFDFYFTVFDSLSYLGDTIATELVFDFGLSKKAVGNIAFESVDPNRRQFLIDEGVSPDSISPFYASSQIQPYLLNDLINFGYNLGQGRYSRYYPLTLTSIENFSQSSYCNSIVHHTEEYLKFAEPFTRQEREFIGGLGTTPAQLPNNIMGGYGYFAVRDRIIDCAFP